MKVEELVPGVERRVPFALYGLRRADECAGCYCLTNATGDVLYIGQAVSIRQRLIQHFDSTKRSVLTPFGRVSVAWWRACADARLNALERGWLEAARLRDGVLPPLNIANPPI
jgi:hypothetical protein